MRIFSTKFEGWCKYFSPIIILESLLKLAPSRNVVCNVTSSIRMAWTLSLNIEIDLPQVNLMNFRVEYVRPWSGRCLGREAAERATKLPEVNLPRLKGFHLCFAPKKWEVAWLATGISDYIWKSLNWMAERICSTPNDQNNRMCVRFSCVDPKSKFVYSVLQWLRRKT